MEVKQTETFRKWMKSLSDVTAKARINVRIRRLSMGNLGDVKSVAKGISEIRIDYGPGYRVYFTEIRGSLVVLISAGDKRTRDQDIRKAEALLKNLEMNDE